MIDRPPSAMRFTFPKAICPFGASLCLHGKDRRVESAESGRFYSSPVLSSLEMSTTKNLPSCE